MRLTVIVASLGLALALSACGSKSNQSSKAPIVGGPSQTQAQAPQKSSQHMGQQSQSRMDQTHMGQMSENRMGASRMGSTQMGSTQMGSSGQMSLKDVQARLKADGYYKGQVDGMNGPLTRQALAAYQRDHGLSQTSRLDAATSASMSQEISQLPRPGRADPVPQQAQQPSTR